MKKFNFRLEKVLTLRKYREDECKIALGQAISALNYIEHEIKENAIRQHHAASQRFIDVGQTNSWDVYIVRLEQEAQKLTEQAAKAEMVVEEKRIEYLQALQELKALEKLKEKRQTEYNKEAEDYEMAEIDEMVAARRYAAAVLG
jgi:flagellar FliJ protein